jgi:hypothetical protein
MIMVAMHNYIRAAEYRKKSSSVVYTRSKYIKLSTQAGLGLPLFLFMRDKYNTFLTNSIVDDLWRCHMVMKIAKPAKRPSRTKKGKRIGHPITTEYDPELIRALAAVGCTVYEIANQCGFSEQNFHDLKKKYPEIQEAIDQGKSELHKSLRKKQIDIAMEGNVPMLIHLGKTQLGQSEKLTLAGDKENPLTMIRLRWGDEVEAAEEETSDRSDPSRSDPSSS